MISVGVGGRSVRSKGGVFFLGNYFSQWAELWGLYMAFFVFERQCYYVVL